MHLVSFCNVGDISLSLHTNGGEHFTLSGVDDEGHKGSLDIQGEMPAFMALAILACFEEIYASDEKILDDENTPVGKAYATLKLSELSVFLP